MSFVSRLSAKSQTVIPKAVRDFLGIKPGDRVEFEIVNGEVILRPRRRAAEDPFAEFSEWSGDNDEKAYADL